MYNRITLLYTVNQLYFNNKNKSMIHTFKKAIFKSILCEVTLLLCLFSLFPTHIYIYIFLHILSVFLIAGIGKFKYIIIFPNSLLRG